MLNLAVQMTAGELISLSCWFIKPVGPAAVYLLKMLFSVIVPRHYFMLQNNFQVKT